MRGIYLDEVVELDALLDLMLHPEKYGCRWDKGDPETYQARAGHIIDTAVVTLWDVIKRPLGER